MSESYSMDDILNLLKGIGILYGFLKLPIKNLLEQTVLEKAISATAEKFGDIEGLSESLDKWLMREETKEAIKDFYNGKQDAVDIERLIAVLTEIGFYFGEESQERAAEVIEVFLDLLSEEVLKSENGLSFLYKRNLEEHKRIEDLVRGLYPDTRPLSFAIDETEGKLNEVEQRIAESLALFKLGKVSESQDLLLEILGQIRDESGYREELAKVYNNLGVTFTFNSGGPERDYDRAIKYFNAALEIRPTFVKAKINLASAYLGKSTQEYIQKGYDLIQTVWATEKTADVLHTLLRAIYHRFDSPEDVISLAESGDPEIRKLIENEDSIINIVVRMYLESKNIEKALDYIGKALDISPRNPESLTLKGHALLLRAQSNNPVMSPLDIVPRLNDYADVEAALDSLKEAKRIAEEQNSSYLLPTIQYGMAKSLIWLGKHEEAKNILTSLKDGQLPEHLQTQIEVMRIVEHLNDRDFGLAYNTFRKSENYAQIDYIEKRLIAEILLYHGAPEQSKLLLNEIEAEAEANRDFRYWLDVSLVNILLENKVGALYAVNKAKEQSAGDDIDREQRKLALSHFGAVILRYSKRGRDARDSEASRLILAIDEYQRKFPEDKAVKKLRGSDEQGNLTEEAKSFLLARKEEYERIREDYKTQQIITYSLAHSLGRAYADLVTYREDPNFTIDFSIPNEEFANELHTIFKAAKSLIFDYLSLLDLSKMNLLYLLEKLGKPLLVHKGLFDVVQQELLMNEIEELRRLWNFLRTSKSISLVVDHPRSLDASQESGSIPDDWLIKSIEHAEVKNHVFVTDDLRLLNLVSSAGVKSVNITVFLKFWLENKYIDKRIYSRALGHLAERFYVFIPFSSDDLLEVVMEDEGKVTPRSYHLVNQIFLPYSKRGSFTGVFVEFISKLWKMGLSPQEKVGWIKFLSLIVSKVVSEADLTKDSQRIDEVVKHLGSMWHEAIENGTNNDLTELQKVVDESLGGEFMFGARKAARQRIIEKLNMQGQNRNV